MKTMVKKFKSFEDARRDLWVMEPTDEYYKRVIEFYELASKLVKPKIQRGVFKFKTFEEAQKHRAAERE
jgi:hypothetical protein